MFQILSGFCGGLLETTQKPQQDVKGPPQRDSSPLCWPHSYPVLQPQGAGVAVWVTLTWSEVFSGTVSRSTPPEERHSEEASQWSSNFYNKTLRKFLNLFSEMISKLSADWAKH